MYYERLNDDNVNELEFPSTREDFANNAPFIFEAVPRDATVTHCSDCLRVRFYDSPSTAQNVGDHIAQILRASL
jgi:hypothetical protein